MTGGWRLDGRAPWATSWQLADWFSVAAETSDGQLVWALVPGSGGSGVAGEALALSVFGATSTVALSFDDCHVADDQVVAVERVGAWRRADRRQASLGQPAVLGVVERAQRLLAELGDEAARGAADGLLAELGARWRLDDDLVDSLASADDVVTEASMHRAACLDLARRSTTALLAAVGGQGADLSHPAQRLAREASFYVIQAQTADGRAATLRSALVPIAMD